MQLLEAIETRRSCRKFTDQVPTDDTVRTLLQYATKAPSATNTQPWRFAIIQDQAMLDRYSEETKRLVLASGNDLAAKYQHILSNPDYHVFHHAPTLIVIYANESRFFSITDCSLAAQNLMLAAHDQGLGTCWIGFSTPLFNASHIKEELSVPTEYEVIAPIIVGYPQRTLPPMEKRAPEIICWKK